jgi:hypothetical protein
VSFPTTGLPHTLLPADWYVQTLFLNLLVIKCETAATIPQVLIIRVIEARVVVAGSFRDSRPVSLFGQYFLRDEMLRHLRQRASRVFRRSGDDSGDDGNVAAAALEASSEHPPIIPLRFEGRSSQSSDGSRRNTPHECFTLYVPQDARSSPPPVQHLRPANNKRSTLLTEQDAQIRHSSRNTVKATSTSTLSSNTSAHPTRLDTMASSQTLPGSYYKPVNLSLFELDIDTAVSPKNGQTSQNQTSGKQQHEQQHEQQQPSTSPSLVSVTVSATFQYREPNLSGFEHLAIDETPPSARASNRDSTVEQGTPRPNPAGNEATSQQQPRASKTAQPPNATMATVFSTNNPYSSIIESRQNAMTVAFLQSQEHRAPVSIPQDSADTFG